MLCKSRILVAISAVTVIAGCAGPQPQWRKEGVSADSTRSAHAECKYQVGLNKITEEKQKEIIANCMEGKGYRWR